MKKLIYTFVLLFAANILFSSCDNNVPVSSVTLNLSEFYIAMNAPAVSLTAIIAPADATNRAVTWTSYDERIATVDANGTVTAVSVGVTAITVITADGAHAATATVTVTPPVISVTGVTLNRDTLELAIGEIETLTATIAPADATNQAVTWRSNNNNIVFVDANGKITSRTAGTATITVTTADGGRTASAVVKVPEVGVVINDVRWATRNADVNRTFAATPHRPGAFFQWNRSRAWSAAGLNVIGWDSSVPTGTAWYADNNPCPLGWRVPTREELQSLVSLPRTWQNSNHFLGIPAGYYFGIIPEQIFLPAAGLRFDSNGMLISYAMFQDVSTPVVYGSYWSSTPSISAFASSLSIRSGAVSVAGANRAMGHSVRCVAE